MPILRSHIRSHFGVFLHCHVDDAASADAYFQRFHANEGECEHVLAVGNVDGVMCAAASALYGQEGANGVILITTKGGKDGKVTVVANGGWEGVDEVGALSGSDVVAAEFLHREVQSRFFLALTHGGYHHFGEQYCGAISAVTNLIFCYNLATQYTSNLKNSK